MVTFKRQNLTVKRQMKWILISLTLIGITFIAMGINGLLNQQNYPHQYWHQSPSMTWEHAPNNWYHVLGSWGYNGTWVFFPMCESSGTELHGVWRTNVYLPDNFDGSVRLENEVIVEKRT